MTVMVRMLTYMVGAPTLDVGDVVSLAPAEAQQWVAAGLAEWWEAPPETAMATPAIERAVRPRGRRR